VQIGIILLQCGELQLQLPLISIPHCATNDASLHGDQGG
jgi:hypothetical protein